MRVKLVALLASAALGIVGGAVTGVALPRADADPLNLGVPLHNLPCSSSGRSVVLVGGGTANDSTALASAVNSNPGARYLQPQDSCNTAWKYQPPHQARTLPDPDYVVYLGPYGTHQACVLRMQGAHKGDFVTTLTNGQQDMVECICWVDVAASAPDLHPGTVVTAETSIWIRQLQEMLLNQGYLAGKITGHYDSATLDAVKSVQRENGLDESGVADADTWPSLARTLCKASP